VKKLERPVGTHCESAAALQETFRARRRNSLDQLCCQEIFENRRGLAVDTRAIGVFDSGLGGLTGLRELQRLLPGEDFIYFGDTGRVPYGSRGKETILRYARQDVAFLRTFHLKAIMAACNTVSATCLDELRAENNIPIFGTIRPAAAAAVDTTRNGRVGLIGTTASIRSGAYERELRQRNPKIRLFAKACPLFVPLVENGRYRLGDRVVELVAEDYLAELKGKGVDTLILGCTHYPLLSAVIASVMGPAVELIDSGATCANEVAETLRHMDALSQREYGKSRFFVSDSTEDFARLAGVFLGHSAAENVEKVEIQKY